MPNNLETSTFSLVKRFLEDRTGATAPEYALILALVIVGTIGAVNLMGDRSSDVINGVAGKLDAGESGAPETPVANVGAE